MRKITTTITIIYNLKHMADVEELEKISTTFWLLRSCSD